MRRLLVMIVGLATAVGPVRAHARVAPEERDYEEERVVLVPMPADIPPHHSRVIVGEHHYDLQPEDYEERHSQTHFISHGQHNYDMSQDPSNRERWDVNQKRYHGMGLGEDERYSMMRRSIEDIDDHAERPWVLHGIKRRGLAYAIPSEAREANEAEYARRVVGFPRPSWYAIYKKQRGVVRE